MKAVQLLKEIEQRKRRTFLFHGSEAFLKEETLKALIDSYKLQFEEFNVSALYGMSINELRVACDTLPFMEQLRIVIAKNSRFLSSPEEGSIRELEDLLKDLCPTTVLVLYEEGKLDARKAVYKMLAKNCAVGEFDALQDWEAAQWVENRAKSGGKEISAANARYLVSLVGCELLALNNELQKLLDYCGAGIEKKDIDKIVTRSVESDVFAMMNLFEGKKTGEGMLQLRTLLLNGEDAPKIIGAMAWRFRMILQAKEFLSKGYRTAQAEEMMGGGYSAQQALKSCAKFSLEQLREAIRLLFSADYDFKNGIRKGQQALEETVLRIYPPEGKK